jgi:hypothetical protein
MFEDWNYPYLRGVRCDPEETDTYTGAVEIAGQSRPWWIAWVSAKTGIEIEGNLALPISPSEVETGMTAVMKYLAKTACDSNPAAAADWVSVGNYLVGQLCWQSKRDSLLNERDYQYFLSHLDFSLQPSPDTHSFLFLFHDGILIPPDLARFRAYDPMLRQEYFQTLYRILYHYHQINSSDGQVREINNREVQIVDERGVHTYPYGNPVYLYQKLNDARTPKDRLACGPGDQVEYYSENNELRILVCELHTGGAAMDRSSKYSFWQETVSPSDLGQRLSRYMDVGDVVDLQPVSYGSSRRLHELKIIGTKTTGTLTGIRIRWGLGLKENLFVIDRVPNRNGGAPDFQFSGRGWGHGIGMCQVGAIGFAKLGKDYKFILQHYYSGVEIKKVY